MMLHSWWNTNMDARRWTSPLIAGGGLAVVAIGIAASPVSAFGSNYSGEVGPVLWAAVAGYALHRDSDHERAPLWALAFGVTAAVILVVTLGMAVVIRPTVLGIPGLGDAWAGLIVSGFLVMFVGAFLWERDARTRRWRSLRSGHGRRGLRDDERRPVGSAGPDASRRSDPSARRRTDSSAARG